MNHVDRTGLYIMVIITMFASCSNSDKLDRLERDVRGMQEPVAIVKPAFPLPDFCLEEYRYPRSDEQARQCFRLLVEEIREHNGS